MLSESELNDGPISNNADEMKLMLCNKEKELEHLYKIIDDIESDVEMLWKSVIVPYLRNDIERQILCGLHDGDYMIFYNYMMENNKMVLRILKRIKYLRSKS